MDLWYRQKIWFHAIDIPLRQHWVSLVREAGSPQLIVYLAALCSLTSEILVLHSLPLLQIQDEYIIASKSDFPYMVFRWQLIIVRKPGSPRYVCLSGSLGFIIVSVSGSTQMVCSFAIIEYIISSKFYYMQKVFLIPSSSSSSSSSEIWLHEISIPPWQNLGSLLSGK